MAVLYYTGACLCLIGILGANAEADPILDRLARLKNNFAHMHHRHRDEPPPQEEASAPQMSFSQAPEQAPHLDLSVLGSPPQQMGPPPQQMMDGNFAPPPLSMGQMNAPQMNGPQPSFEAPQANFAPPAPQDDEEPAPRMEEGRRDDDDDAGSARESQAAKSDPIVQRLALLKSNFKRMHGSHRLQRNMDTQSMDQNNQATEGGNNAGDFQRPLEQTAPEGAPQYQPNPAPGAPVDSGPSALDMSTPNYGSPKPLAFRKPVFGLKMPDMDQPQDEDDSRAGPAPQANFVQGQEDDNQQGPVDEDPPQPRSQRSGSFDRQSDPIIARLSRFRDNIEQIKNSKSLSGGRGRPQPALPQEQDSQSDDQLAQQNGMTAFANYQPDASSEPESQGPQESQAPQDNYPQENSRFQGFQSRPPASHAKSSMSAAEVIAKLQMEGNAQLQAEFHPQAALGGGFMSNVLPGVQPDPQGMAESGAMQHPDSMEGEDMDRQEAPPMRTHKRMNLWAQSQQQDQGAPMQQQFFQQRDQMQQGPGFAEQSPEQEAPMQTQWGPQGGQAAFNQMEDQPSQGPPDSDQDREQPADQGPVDNQGPRQDDMEEERPAAIRQRDDPIVDRLGMLQNNFKRIRNHAHIQKKLISENQDLESRSDNPAANQESFVQNSDSADAGDSEAQQSPGDGPEQDSHADNDSADQNSMSPPAPDADQDQGQDADAMPPRSMSAPHRWSLLQGQSTSSQGDIAQSSRDIAQNSHEALAQFTKAQAAVDPEVAATDKSIDAQVAEAESVGPSSAITDLISKHSHQHIDDRLAMIQENFERMHMRRR
eukprot:gnl/MRDRNA2_/MRDRNA2_34271_c0_seq2.p1 gnl/MRDRNA2_/MRDRNA2_34271_c0~~gnl/MRDRNA2_/MRDRNA2_34271_c0_seq2.p1  ORF type:complete len:818 (+),score=198.86 gnl/MRDRNA2_/MRDRNA2_34271_c0_seq2:192-2645(+)